MPRNAGHRPDRTAMAAGGQAGGRAGRGAPRTRGRLSAPQPRAPAPGTPGAHASGLRCLRAAGCGAHAARGSPGHRERSNAAGAERSASRAAHRASRRAEPAAGEPAGGRRKIRTGAPERGGSRAGRGKEGGAPPPRAAQAGHPPAPGIPPGDARGSPGEGLGWWAGRPPTAPRDLQGPARSLKPGADRFSGSGLSRARQPAHRWPGRGSGLRRPRPGARLQTEARGRGARGRFRCSSLPPAHPSPRLPAALRGCQRAAVRHPARSLDRGLRESSRAPAR